MSASAATNDEPARIITDHEAVAGRPRSCDDCGGIIGTGERYRRITLARWGFIESTAHHVPLCPAIRRAG